MAPSSPRYPVCLVSVRNSDSPPTKTASSSSIKLRQNISPKPSVSKPDGLLKDFSSDLGCSGVIIDYKQGLVLTTAVPFAGFIPNIQGDKVGHQSYSPEADVYKGEELKYVAVHVITEDVRENRNCDTDAKTDLKPQQLVASSNRTRRSENESVSLTSDLLDCSNETDATVETSFIVHEAKVLLLWQCHSFNDAVRTLLPKGDGWVVDYGEKDDEIGARSSLGETQNENQVERIAVSGRRNEHLVDLVSWFALLKVDGGIRTPRLKTRFIMTPSSGLYGGQPVTACGTPFAVLCPSIFTNSISNGVITKVAGDKGALVMTDARCIPGMEGGGLFVEDTESSTLAALIVSPLCWKANEWIGLTLACSVDAILDSLGHVIRDNGPMSISERCIVDGINKRYSLMSGTSHHLQKCFTSVVLVRVGPVWGSGVIVNAGEGLVLTCRHVVKSANIRGVQIRLHSQRWTKASLLYTTSDSSPLDLAILKIEDASVMNNPHSLVDVQMSSDCSQGSRVYVIGYPLLDPSVNTSPLVTSGIVSKVIYFNRQPVMLQSTCAVHSGASGGALLCASTGRLLGIVASNSRDAGTGASFPHVNFIIPVACFKPVLDQYISTKDPASFKSLDNQNTKVASIWELEEKAMYRRCHQAKSKL